MYLVAGASGNVGSVVARELLRAKQPVKVLLRDPAAGAEWEKQGARVVVGSLEDVEALSAALDGTRAAFLLQPPSYRAPNFLARQADLATSVERALQKSGAPRVVLLSSFGAHLADGTGPIKGCHWLESAVRRSGASLAAYRSCYFQKNVQNALGPARGARIFPVLAPGPDEAFPQIAGADVGRFIALAMQASASTEHEVVDLVGPSYSHTQVANLLGRTLGFELRVTVVPREGWGTALKQSGMSDEAVQLLTEMNDAFSKGLLVGVAEQALQGSTPIEATIDQVLSR